MSSSDRDVHPFVVRALDAFDSVAMDTRLTVFDGDDRNVAEGEGEVNLELPVGLYAVRAERPGTIAEELLRHRGPTSHDLRAPKRYSTVPTTDVHATDPDDAERARTHSTESTAGPLEVGGAPSGRLFLYVRHPDPETWTGGAQSLSLHRLDGELVTGFPQGTVTEGRNWFVFNADATPGLYLLRRSDDRPREMAVWVYDGWATQVFMLHADRPHLASTSQLLSPVSDGFAPDDRSARLTDLAMQGLVNAAGTVPTHDITDLLFGKFQNPMFGLLGAHLALRTGQTFTAMSDVIDNLEHMIGDVPDVRALRIALADQSEEDVDVEPFWEPPGLNAGFEAVVSATARYPDLVSEQSPLSAIALERYSDSAWTTWRPFRRPSADRSAGDEAEADESAPPAWVNNYIEEAIVASARRGEHLDISAVITESKIPASSVAHAYEAIRSGSEPGLQRTITMEKAISLARRAAVGPGVDRDDLARQYRDGRDGERIEMLGLMQGHEDLRSFETALEGISDSRSAFEQYHALRLAGSMVADLGDDERERLRSAIEEQRGPDGWIEEGTDRWAVSSRVLEDL